MRHLSFKTKSANEQIVKRDWYLVDATNQTVGRMCTQIAHILRGKNKAYYTPHFDCGDYVIVTNAAQTFAGAKTFSNDVTAPNFLGNATTATTAALGIEPSNNWMKLISDGTVWYVIRALF